MAPPASSDGKGDTDGTSEVVLTFMTVGDMEAKGAAQWILDTEK